jgi:hypothetical protein
MPANTEPPGVAGMPSGGPGRPVHAGVPLPVTDRVWTSDVHITGGLLFGGVVAIAAALRFAGLGHNSIWFDEAYVLRLTRFDWRDLFQVLRVTDAHPPLYYLLMKAWGGVAGTGEAAIRFPSACLSVTSVILTYALMRRIQSGPVALLSAFLVAVSPFAVMAGQEARMYALLGTLTLASTLALHAGVDRGGALRWAGYGVLAALTAYTQYLGILVLVAHGLWMVGYERRHLRSWLGSMAVAAVLYAPWAPSLWYQTIHGNGWPWYRHDAAFPDLGDLLGLYAFGGSLIGMGSYFFPGTRGPLAQGLILLPFLVVLWRGVASLGSERRTLALLVLPPAVTIVVISALSLVNLISYPRWFSFLLPFYAMLLARGITDAAGHVRSHRDHALAVLTAGLLLYSVPVFGRYYFDPHFRPYPWRDAAGLVRELGKPGDFFLFVNSAAEISFSYYVREPHPSLTLVPIEAAPGGNGSPTFTNPQAAQLAARYPRVWLIATPPFTKGMQQRLLPPLTSAFRVVGQRTYPAIWLHLLEAKPQVQPRRPR